jgi:4-amino-4-deoxy-L-arabinose transferase-like glycosyltransferase
MVPSPPHPKSYLVPFVVDFEGERFSKYPFGWPAVLSIGILFGMRHLVNPLLAGLGVWLTYKLGKRTFGELVGLLAAALTITSPFFLMNSGSFLSHPLGLVLSAGFTLAWLNTFFSAQEELPWRPAIAAALCMGFLIVTRPFTALAIGLPFFLHALYLFIRGGVKIRRVLIVGGVIILLFVGLYLLWQAALTGDPMLNPYTLWWEYDRIGFGPGHGHTEMGHTLQKAYTNTRHSLEVGAVDLFGWGTYSWIFLPFGIWAARRNRPALLMGSVFPALVLLYMAYWIGSSLFGPRYYYEGLFSLTLISAAGISFLAGWPVKAGESVKAKFGYKKIRPLAVTWLLGVIVAINLLFFVPMRLGGMRGLYGIEKSDQKAFLSSGAEELTPALIIVHTERWMEYGALLDIQDPYLSTPFIFAWSNTPKIDASLAQDFPQRAVFHYYPDEPYIFYTDAKPEP